MLVGFWSVAAAVGLYSFSIVILLLVCCSKNVSVRSKIILLSAEKRLRRHSAPPHAFSQGVSEGGPETANFWINGNRYFHFRFVSIVLDNVLGPSGLAK